jgi:hypothetical protein
LGGDNSLVRGQLACSDWERSDQADPTINVWQPDKLGSQLVSANLDKPDLLTKDLWVAPELWEDQVDRRLSANDDSSSSNSEYYEVEEGGEYEGDEYEDGEYSDSEYVLFE